MTRGKGAPPTTAAPSFAPRWLLRPTASSRGSAMANISSPPHRTTRLPENLASGIASLLPQRLPRRVRRPRSCQNHPIDGRRGDKLPTAIVDPTPTTPASASPTQADAPANPQSRPPPQPAPAGSFLGGFRKPALSAAG